MFDNNKLGEIRPNQLITTFGPGSIVDAVKDSVTVLDLNYWKEKGKKIIDGRLPIDGRENQSYFKTLVEELCQLEV